MKEYKYKINGKPYTVSVGDIEGKNVTVEVNGVAYSVELEKEAAPKIKPIARVSAPATVAPAAAPRQAAPAGKGAICSPLPGVILEVKIKEGDNVKRGQTLMVLEAMKMENDIKADRDGKVTKISVSKGESILEGTELISIE